MLERTLAPVNGARSFEPKNRLLAALPHEILSSLRPHLRAVSLPRGRVLSEADEPLGRVYFVQTGAVSLMTVFEDGTTAEMATVGREGMVGIGTMLGGDTALSRYVAPVSGSALAIEVCRFQSELRASPQFRAACDAYAQAFIAHLLQNVACNAAHRLEQRCARWLLMCADQSENDRFELTQKCLAEMLGVRRSAVTVEMCTLQQRGLVQYRRGSITVLDRRGLEATACGCYRTVRAGYERSNLSAKLASSDHREGHCHYGDSRARDLRSSAVRSLQAAERTSHRGGPIWLVPVRS